MAQPEKVKLHDGELVLTRNPGASSKWQYRLTLPGGGYERLTTGKRDLTEAKAVAEARYQEVKWRDQRGLSHEVLTFREAAEDFIVHLTKQAELTGRAGRIKRAKEWADRITNYLIPYFGDMSVDLIDTPRIQAFHDHYAETWEANKSAYRTQTRTKNNQGVAYKKPLVVKMPNSYTGKPGVASRTTYESMIRQAIALALVNKKVTAAEVNTFQATEPTKNRRGGFSAAEEARLLKHLEERITQTPKKHHQAARRLLWLYVRFQLLTGMRPGVEPGSVRWCDIEERLTPKRHFVVKVRKGKTGPRAVLVDAALGDVLDELRTLAPNTALTDLVWKQCRFGHGFDETLAELGMEKDDQDRARTLYSLRHTTITRMIEKSVDINLIAKNCGTSVEQISNHYDHSIHTLRVDDILK
ncbi:hypothetical protein [Roseomonas chloroacetimidivorans]|uniref:hypothetical protein n=1 Tax=Roseomonas chloroacetimidivorans TaxID=1766656 RepID=UPI003C73F35C